jgi:aspartyl-tRNA(Asn)/glutamyl-tRNA(Gln) amidotransferase subunit C
MLTMTRDEIQHLASLARIRLSETEMDSLEVELPKIIDYVSVVSKLAGEDPDTSPQLGARHNVLRPDEVTNEPGAHTEAILKEMPETKNGFLKVKKILQTDE